MKIVKKLSKLVQIVRHREEVKKAINHALMSIEAPGESYWGSITEEDEAGIKRAVIQAGKFEGPIVEIGALFGHTTALIASLKRNETPLFAVDNFTWNPFGLTPKEHRLFLMRTIRLAIDQSSTRVFDGSASEFYAANPDLKPSLVFIDAAHDYSSVRRDIEWAISTDCPVISGHDYSSLCPGVIRAVDELLGKSISLFGSVWIYESAPGKQTVIPAR